MSCDKLLDVPKRRLHFARKVKVILTGVFDEFGIRHVRRKVATKLDGDRSIASAMKHKRRGLFVRKYRPDVNLGNEASSLLVHQPKFLENGSRWPSLTCAIIGLPWCRV
jgi:hypothetical protein